MPHHRPARYCPQCGARLVRQDDHGTKRPTCPRCGFVHYRNPVPAAGVILHEGDRVLLVKRRYAPRAGAWCLPAGFMEYGETPRQCAVRELREETGLGCRLGGLFGVYAGFDDPRVRAVLVIYEAVRTGGRLSPGDDAIAARWFSVRRPPRAIAFEAHRQALAEFAAAIRERPARARAGGRGSASSGRPVELRRPRRAPAARTRSRRA